MKKSVKIILPVLLVLLLFIGAGLYLFVFRSGISTGFYLNRADAAAQAGRYSWAIKYYNAAVKLDDSDPAVYIRLADAYEKSDNYTKAEYTLVSAITKHPDTTDLYVALSRAYVAQGKFLDADQMLTGAVNEKAQAELSEMRPKSPTLSPESGYYSTYVTVSAKCENGRIYLTTNGAYPSDQRALYEGPVELQAGESTVCALTVDDNGLVSPAVYVGYTVGGVIEEIVISDGALDALIRSALGKQAGDTLMTNELWTISELEIDGGVNDLSQLSSLTGLKALTIKSVSAPDFTGIGKLTQLTKLDISDCILSAAAVKAIGALPDLTVLRLSGCAVNDIAALKGLKKLTSLDLSQNSISEIAALGGMTALQGLDLSGNAIASVTALSGCTALENVNLAGCAVASVDAFGKCTALTTLNISDNAVTDIGVLAACSKLQKLNASSNKIAAIDVLASLPELTSFDGSYNEIAAIPKFDAAKSKLQSINLNYNSVSSVSGLGGLIYLNYVKVDYNKVTDIGALEECANLVQVDVWDNPVSSDSISALQSHSIIVNYDPNY